MKSFIYTILVGLIVTACTSSSVTLPSTSSGSTKVGALSGKWINHSNQIKVFFEDEIEKIVLSNGCQVVSANFNVMSLLLIFRILRTTQKTCETAPIDLAQVLKQTVIIKVNINK
jgi:hypothetical protein